MRTVELIAIILPVVGFLISVIFLVKVVFWQGSDSKGFGSWSLPHTVVTIPCQVPNNYYLYWQNYQNHYAFGEKYQTVYEKPYTPIGIKESGYGRNEEYS